eukprot:4945636-Amphidinium_carterae.2
MKVWSSSLKDTPLGWVHKPKDKIAACTCLIAKRLVPQQHELLSEDNPTYLIDVLLSLSMGMTHRFAGTRGHAKETPCASGTYWPWAGHGLIMGARRLRTSAKLKSTRSQHRLLIQAPHTRLHQAFCLPPPTSILSRDFGDISIETRD